MVVFVICQHLPLDTCRYSLGLQAMPQVTELQSVPDSFVPVIKLKFSGISIDLLFAALRLLTVPEPFHIAANSTLRGVDDRTVRCLNGCRVTDTILAKVCVYLFCHYCHFQPFICHCQSRIKPYQAVSSAVLLRVCFSMNA
jgi:poly(A) polymerase Pap1